MTLNANKYWALATVGCATLWSVQATAQNDNVQQGYNAQAGTHTQIDSLQQQINNLQQQVQTLRNRQIHQQAIQQRKKARNTAAKAKVHKGPKKKLTLGGATVVAYQKGIDSRRPEGGRKGGHLVSTMFLFNAAGQYGNLTYGAEERWSQNNFVHSDEYLHYGWVDYAFGPDKANHVRGGFFQVPFGNYPVGYQNYWGSLAYYLGFTDNQAAGIGYNYEDHGWRVDIDAFKNDDLTQQALYGSNPFEGYQQINGGNGRIAYTFNHGGDNTVTVSVAGRGGQLEVGENDSGHHGDSSESTRWAGTAAIDAELGNWTLQAQFVDYRYNIPSGQTYGGNVLPTDSITFENYGAGYQVPAAGQMYAANIAYTFPVQWGPVSQFQLYDNYGYLSPGKIGSSHFNGHFNSALPGDNPNRTGATQANIVGVEMAAGPLYIWGDVISGKNAGMIFDGPNDGRWHHRFNLAAGIYFNGDVVNAQ